MEGLYFGDYFIVDFDGTSIWPGMLKEVGAVQFNHSYLDPKPGLGIHSLELGKTHFKVVDSIAN